MEGGVVLEAAGAGPGFLEDLDIKLVPKARVQLEQVDGLELVPGNIQEHACLDRWKQVVEGGLTLGGQQSHEGRDDHSPFTKNPPQVEADL